MPFGSRVLFTSLLASLLIASILGGTLGDIPLVDPKYSPVTPVHRIALIESIKVLRLLDGLTDIGVLGLALDRSCEPPPAPAA